MYGCEDIINVFIIFNYDYATYITVLIFTSCIMNMIKLKYNFKDILVCNVHKMK